MRHSRLFSSQLILAGLCVGTTLMLVDLARADGPLAEPVWANGPLGPPPCMEGIPEMPPEMLLAPPLPVYGRVIGVREDPINAYPDLAEAAYPLGVPPREVPFALELLRSVRAQQMLYQPAVPVAVPPGGEDLVPPPVESPVPAPDAIPPAPVPGAPVTSLLMDAYPASSRGNADWDVLVIELQAVDAAGLPIAVSGTLTARLFGRQQRFVLARGDQFIRQLGEVEQLASWTRNVGVTSPRVPGSESVVRLELPLPRPLPEHELKVAPWGDVTANLTVPGQGIFSASRSDVALRHLSELRDENLIETGTRFFHRQPTSGGRRPTTFRPQLRSELRPHSRIFAVQP